MPSIHREAERATQQALKLSEQVLREQPKDFARVVRAFIPAIMRQSFNIKGRTDELFQEARRSLYRFPVEQDEAIMTVAEAVCRVQRTKDLQSLSKEAESNPELKRVIEAKKAMQALEAEKGAQKGPTLSNKITRAEEELPQVSRPVSELATLSPKRVREIFDRDEPTKRKYKEDYDIFCQLVLETIQTGIPPFWYIKVFGFDERDVIRKANSIVRSQNMRMGEIQIMTMRSGLRSRSNNSPLAYLRDRSSRNS